MAFITRTATSSAVASRCAAPAVCFGRPTLVQCRRSAAVRSTGPEVPPPLPPLAPKEKEDQMQKEQPKIVNFMKDESVSTGAPPKPLDALPDNEVTKPAKDVLAWYGPAPETINGRLAMLGFIAAMAAELSSGLPLFQQVRVASGPILTTFGILIVASFVPIWRGVNLNAGFGPFTKVAELINGRAAMFGLTALAITEILKGGALFVPPGGAPNGELGELLKNNPELVQGRQAGRPIALNDAIASDRAVAWSFPADLFNGGGGGGRAGDKVRDTARTLKVNADVQTQRGGSAETSTPGGGKVLEGGAADAIEGSGQYEGPRGDADITKGVEPGLDDGAIKEATDLVKGQPYF